MAFTTSITLFSKNTTREPIRIPPNVSGYFRSVLGATPTSGESSSAVSALPKFSVMALMSNPVGQFFCRDLGHVRSGAQHFLWRA
jgi:hypothetical protein